MRIRIIGAVAAGTSAAAKARRNDEDADIVLYEKDAFISYSGCGMPYYLGGLVTEKEQLTPRDPAFFQKKYRVDIQIRHEVLSIDPARKSLEVKNLATGEVFTDWYDKLVLATGAQAVIPPLPGGTLPHVFTLRNIVDMNRIDTFLQQKKPRRAVIVGTGFIGLEMCENLVHIGMDVTLVEKLPQVTPGLDSDMAVLVSDHLRNKSVQVYTETSVQEITADEVVLDNGDLLPADLVLLSVGVKPNVELARQANIELGTTGAIKVDHRMQTSVPDIYACGDCIEHYHLITGKPVYRPLGSTANKTGRITGDVITGGTMEFRGVLGTGIFRIFDLTVAQTGLTEREAKQMGYDIETCINIKPSKPDYLGGKEMVIKAIADKTNGRMLGVQIIGQEGVDKRIDVFVTALSFGAKAEDLFHLDLAYAPPFSTTKDPIHYTGMILDNAIHKQRPLITAQALTVLQKSGKKLQIIDTRAKKQYDHGHVEGAQNIPHEEIRQALDTLDKETTTVTYCNKGVTGNAVQNILKNKGFHEVLNLSGGYRTYVSTERYNETKD